MAEGSTPLDAHNDYYKFIGLDRNATEDQIKRRIREKAKQFHPDKTHRPETENLMKDLNKVKSVLLDDIEKKKYDEDLASRAEPDIPLFMKKNRGTILLPPAPRYSKKYTDQFYAAKRRYSRLPKPSEELWTKLDQEAGTIANDIQANHGDIQLTVSSKRNIMMSHYDTLTNPAGATSQDTSGDIYSILGQMHNSRDCPTPVSATEFSIGERVPILDTSSASVSDLCTLLSLFVPDTPRSASKEEMARQLSQFIPTTAIQAPPAQKFSSNFCASCSRKHRWYSKKFSACYWCSRSFCNDCPLEYQQHSRIGPSPQKLCSQCIEDFTRADAQDWAEASMKFIAKNDDESVIAAMGCASLAIKLGFKSHDLLKNMARELHQLGQHDYAFSVISLAISMQHDVSSTQQLKVHHLASSILLALARSRQRSLEERLYFALASKEAYLHAMYLNENQIEVVDDKKEEIDALVEQLDEERINEHVLSYTMKLESLWSQRNILGILNFLKEKNDYEDSSAVPEDATLKALKSFLQNKKPFLSSMLADDRNALLFLKSILKLKKRKCKSSLSIMENVVWNHSHSDILEEKHTLGVFLQVMSHADCDLYSYEALTHSLLSGSATFLCSKKNTTQQQDRSESLLFPSDFELTPPFKKNWPSLSVVGLNTKCHEKYEEAVLRLHEQKKWSALRVAWAYMDELPGCEHPAEMVVCRLHAAMWLAKHLNKKSNLDLTTFFALKSVIMALVQEAYLIAFRFLNPGMQLYAIRLIVGIMGKVMQVQNSKLVIRDEDTEFLQEVLKRLVKVSQLFPYWEPPPVSVAEAALFHIITRNLHSSFILGLQLVNPAYSPLSKLDLKYQLYENDLRGVLSLENSSDARASAMEELLKSQGWSWSDVVHIMTSRLVERDQQGWLKQSLSLRTSQEYSEVTGFILDTDPEHPSLQLLVVKADTRGGKVGLLSQDDINTMLQLDKSDLPLCFSLDAPKHDLDKLYHPFQQWRYSSEKVKDTEVLNTMFITDYIMKSFTVGSEVSALPPFKQRSCKEGLTKNLPANLQRALRSIHDRGGVHPPQGAHRFWIEAKEMTYDCQQKGSKIEFHFSEMEMIVKSHSLIRRADGDLTDADEEDDPDSPHATFARDMTENYAELSHYFPVFARLRQLSKLQTFALFLQGVLESLKESSKKENINIPQSLVENIQEEACKHNLANLSTALTKMKEDIGSWPQASDRFLVRSKVNEVKEDMRRRIQEEEDRLRRIHGYNVFIDNSDALRMLDNVESDLIEALRKNDESVLSQVTEALMSQMNINQGYSLKSFVRNWLASSSIRSQQELINYISPFLPVPTSAEIFDQVLRHHQQQYTACSTLVSKYKNRTPHKPSSCNWVPAAICSRSASMSYGGVAFVPLLTAVRDGERIVLPRRTVPVVITRNPQQRGKVLTAPVGTFSVGTINFVSISDPDVLTHLLSMKEMIGSIITSNSPTMKSAKLDLINRAAVSKILHFASTVGSSGNDGGVTGEGAGGGGGGDSSDDNSDSSESSSFTSNLKLHMDPFEPTSPAVNCATEKKGSKKELKICSWNLKCLTAKKVEDKGALEVICCSILKQGCDVIALQEVGSRDALEKVCQELNNPSLPKVQSYTSNTRQWKFCVSNKSTGKMFGGNEYGVFLWNKCSGVKLESAGMIESKGNDLFTRYPFVGKFSVEGRNFVVVNVHLKADGDRKSRRTLKKELRSMLPTVKFVDQTIFNNANSKDSRVVLLGDFNMNPSSRRLRGLKEQGYINILGDDKPTNISAQNLGGTECYDNFWIPSNLICEQSGGVERDGLQHPEKDETVSDHCPITGWIKV